MLDGLAVALNDVTVGLDAYAVVTDENAVVIEGVCDLENDVILTPVLR